VKKQRFEDHLCPRPQGTTLTSPRELHHTQSPGKQQISSSSLLRFNDVTASFPVQFVHRGPWNPKLTHTCVS